MKKWLTTIALVTAATSANAGLLSEWDLVQLAKNPGDISRQESIRAEMEESEENAGKWLRVWSKYERQNDFGKTWSEIGLNLLRWSQPGKTYEWNSSVNIQGSNVPIYKQDSLIDLERAHAYQLSYGQTTGTIHPYTIVDTNRPHHETVGTSQRLLTMGLAPVGPDNEFVRVCKLGRSTTAPFIEMSETQRQHFAKISGLDLSFCLQGREANEYWKSRYHDFVDRFHDRKDNHRPGGSW